MFMETLGFYRTFFKFLNPSERMSFQILYQDKAVSSNLLWHMCGKLQNLKLDGNAAMKIASTRLVGKLIDDPL